jgi:DNA polymerase
MAINEKRLMLPNGSWIDYRGLEREKTEWVLTTRRGRTKYYGAKLIENVVQALARLVMSQAMLRIEVIQHLRPCMTTHDEVVYIFNDYGELTERMLYYIIEELTRPPLWMPDIPLAAEGAVMERYDK